MDFEPSSDREVAPSDEETDALPEEENCCSDAPCALSQKICNPETCECEACLEDLQCSQAEAPTFCVGGRCEPRVCGTPPRANPPENGVDLPTNPGELDVHLDDRRILWARQQTIFPIGLQPMNPSYDLLLEAQESGYILAVSQSPCCRTADERAYQSATYLPQAWQAHIYSSVIPVWPAEQIDQPTAELYDSLTERCGISSLLYWSLNEPEGESREVEIRDFVHQACQANRRPFAMTRSAGFTPDESVSEADILIVRLNPADPAPGKEISRAYAATQKAVWALIPAAQLDARRLRAVALHALAHGARGVLFENPQPEERAWWPNGEKTALLESARFLRDRTDWWLNTGDSPAISLESAPDSVGIVEIDLGDKGAVAILVNTGSEEAVVTLRFALSERPFCLQAGEEGEFDLTRQESLERSLPPNGYDVVFFGESVRNQNTSLSL